MKKLILLKVLLILLLSHSGLAQDRNVFRSLVTLKTVLDRTESMFSILPNRIDRNLKSVVEMKLAEAQTTYNRAVSFAEARDIPAATREIEKCYALLRQIEILINEHPVLKIQFQELLDRRLQQAETLVHRSQNQDAIYMLGRSKFFRRRAYQLFRDGRTYAAIQLYQLALYFSEQVIKVTDIKNDGGNTNDWQRMYQETRLLLDRASVMVEDSNTGNRQRLREMVRHADKEMGEINRKYNDREYNVARQKLQTVNRTVHKIIDLAENIPQDQNTTLLFDIESLEFSIQSIQENVKNSKNSTAQLMYTRLEKWVRQAKRFHRNGRLRLAKRNVEFASKGLSRIYRMLNNEKVSTPDNIADQIDRADAAVNNLDQPSLSKSAKFEKLLTLIRFNLDLAKKNHQADDNIKAAYYLNVVNRLVLRYTRMNRSDRAGNIIAENVIQDLQRLATLLERVKNTANRDVEFEVKYNNAQKLHELASEAYEEGELVLAKGAAKMGITLLTE